MSAGLLSSCWGSADVSVPMARVMFGWCEASSPPSPPARHHCSLLWSPKASGGCSSVGAPASPFAWPRNSRRGWSTGTPACRRLQLHPITPRDNGAIPKCLRSPCQAQTLSSKGLRCIGRALFSYGAFKATLSLAVCVLQAVALQGGRYLVQGQLRHGRFGTSLPVATGGMCPPPPPQNAGGAALPAPTPAGSPSPTPRAWELGAGGSGSSNTQPPSRCMG